MIQKSKEFLSIEKVFKNIQKEIIQGFTYIDDKSHLNTTSWKYKHGGGGKSCEISDGDIIEKGMVNYSSIKGKVLPNSALAKKNKGEIKNFFATGVSVVIHPNNPFVPCSHLNVRYFETDKKDKWWFGGGYDLTPYFVFKDDIKLWHDNTKKTCDNYDKRFYGNFSKQCDEYFYIEHRKEKRGVGGIFYDNLNKNDKEFYKNFSRDVAFTYLDSYLNIIKRRNKKKYSKAHKEFQHIRRGRYVEFNLLYDRGTIFGLQSGGRPESILMSMPPNVVWKNKLDSKIQQFEKKLKKYL